jgi:uncharacterized protein (DUF58 family)
MTPYAQCSSPCPFRVERRPLSPTPRSAAILGVVAFGALFLPVGLILIAGLAVLAAAAVDALLVRSPTEVERETPANLYRGVPARLRLRAGPARGRVRLRQPVPPDLRLEPSEADDELDANLVGLRRGRHLLPAPATRTIGPLGLGCWYHRPGTSAELTVYPDLPAARRLALAVRRGRFQLEGRARGPLGIGTEFEFVREYQPDDDLRQVNWRATERTGHPMSNQYRVERDRDVICVVDTGRLMAAPLPDRTRLDAAIDAAVAVATVADELADRVGAIAFERTVTRFVRPRRAGARAVVRALFDLEPVATDSDYEQAFTRIGESKRALVFVFTDLLDESAARPLIDAVPMLARRHVVVVASATDPDLEPIVADLPTSALEVYEASVALDVLAARTRARQLLLAAGADVLEAAPDGLATVCVRAYLRAKARARV